MTTRTRIDRRAEALKLLELRGQWLVLRRAGRVIGAGLPSRSRPNRYHGVTLAGACTCEDYARGHQCAHALALALAVEQRRRARTVVLAARVGA